MLLSRALINAKLTEQLPEFHYSYISLLKTLVGNVCAANVKPQDFQVSFKQQTEQ